jgi:hypothetical protein
MLDDVLGAPSHEIIGDWPVYFGFSEIIHGTQR